jgi:hypothetical protein
MTDMHPFQGHVILTGIVVAVLAEAVKKLLFDETPQARNQGAVPTR